MRKHLTRTVLERTMDLVRPHDPGLADRLAELLLQPTIAPRGGSSGSDRFEVTLTAEELERLFNFAFDAEEATWTPERNPQCSDMARLADEWNRLTWEDDDE